MKSTDLISEITVGDGLVLTSCSGHSTTLQIDDIVLKKEIAKLVKEEVGKIFLELFLNGDIPLSEAAKKYFADKL